MTTATDTTATIRPATSTAFGRFSSLAKAEWLQFIRNRTLLFMMVFPILFGVGIYFLLSASGEAFAAANAIEVLVLLALAFVLYYSVLSMATTRRDEKVLKRLRTGEASDTEILASLAAPGVIATLAIVVLSSVVIWALGAPTPVNPLLILLAILLGSVLCWGLALLTSGLTQNAEAAQMTSMPVILLAVLSQANVRAMFPDTLRELVDATPFAVVSDLAQLGWTGATIPELAAGETALGFAGTFAHGWPALLILLVWAGLSAWAGVHYLKWDTRN